MRDRRSGSAFGEMGPAGWLAIAALAAGCGSPTTIPPLGVADGGASSDAPLGDSALGAADAANDAEGGAIDPSDAATSHDAAPVDGGAIDASPTSDCYSEPHFPTVSLADLESAYSSGDWLATSLEVMKRRYPLGSFVLDAEKGDSQLAGFADPGSWSSQMVALMTMVHEETHGWDFEHSATGHHAYVVGTGVSISVPELPGMWTRSEIVPLLTDDATSTYDDTYLTGEQGTYDVVFLADELTAYTNGLAALAAISDQITDGISARDGVAAHLYWLELYLRVGRTSHPTQYAAMKADAGWQKLVRMAWARGHFWDAVAKPNPNLAIDAEKIWAHAHDAANEDEIVKFTGASVAEIACHP